MLDTSVKIAIDTYLASVETAGANWFPDDAVPQQMKTGSVDVEEQLVRWQPVNSTVGNTDIAVVEQAVAAPLSQQFKDILLYKHFMELRFGDMWMFPHPTKGWQEILANQVFQSFPREQLFDKGYLPFAAWGDWGRYCFALGEKNSTGEYAVYQWDHGEPDQFYFAAPCLNLAIHEAISRAA